MSTTEASMLSVIEPERRVDTHLVRKSSAGAVRLLVVDDDPVQALLLRLMLEHQGVETDLATDGAEAVEAVRTGDYALVLMDYRMPGMNGIDATRKIRRWEFEQQTRRTPIVAATASGMASECSSYLAAGMDDVVLKPFSAASLARLLTRYARVVDGPDQSEFELDHSMRRKEKGLG